MDNIFIGMFCPVCQDDTEAMLLPTTLEVYCLDCNTIFKIVDFTLEIEEHTEQ